MSEALACAISGRGRFLVIGAGGLGCPALLGLLAGGAEHITIVDDDRIDASNLQRQVLFGLADIGRPKADVARWALLERAPAGRPAPTIEVERTRVGIEALPSWLATLPRSPTTVVLECTDDPALKFAVHDACVEAELPVVIGGVLGFRGQVIAIDKRRSDRACMRCLFEQPPPRELAPACAAAGVLGAVAGVLGQWMALLALRLAEPFSRGRLTEPDADPAAGTLIALDLLRNDLRRLAPPPRPDCPICARAGAARRSDPAPERQTSSNISSAPA